MSDDTELQWGYDAHPQSVRDVEDHAEWRRQERWAIERSLRDAHVSQYMARPYDLRGFCEKFETMLLAYLHEPLNICCSEREAEDTTEQRTLFAATDGGNSLTDSTDTEGSDR